MKIPLLNLPEKSDSLSDEETQKLIDTLDAKGVSDAKCELCGTSHWSIDRQVVTPLSLPQLGPGPSFPSVLLVCTNCGNTKLMNLIALGVRRRIQPKETDNG